MHLARGPIFSSNGGPRGGSNNYYNNSHCKPNMNFLETKLDGVFIIEPDFFSDHRGVFVKTFHKGEFRQRRLEADFMENFFSESKRNVIRGMHFQTPPHDHAKLIYVTRGAIIDVVLDIRNNSPHYGGFITAELSDINKKMIYIPRGCAHGFAVANEPACVVYLQTSMHKPDHDAGILWNSFLMDWGIDDPIISDRDKRFPKLKDYQSPFYFGGKP